MAVGIDNDRFADPALKLTSVSFDFDLTSRPRSIHHCIEGKGRTGLIRDYHQSVRPHVHVRESA